MAATEKMTYAKAISNVAKHTVVTKSKPASAHALGGRPDGSSGERGRTDVFDAPTVQTAKKQRKVKTSTFSIGCQTDPEPVEAVTQTTMDCASQTEKLPEEISTQTTTDVEIQTCQIAETFDEKDKFVIAAIHDMMTLISRYMSRRMAADAVYKIVFGRFDKKALEYMKQHKYWEKYNESDGSSEEESDGEEDKAKETSEQSADKC